MTLATRCAAAIALVALLPACEEPDGWKPGGSCGAGTFPLDGATDIAETVVLETDADQGVETGLELRDASGGLVSGYSSIISWPVPFFGNVHILQFHPAAPLQFSGRYDGAVLWGGEVACRFSFTIRAPGSGSWTATTTVDAPAGRSGHTAVWTGSEMIVWGGRTDIFGGAPLGDGARYDPVVWTGRVVLAWGGYGSEDLGWVEDASVLDGGGLWDPSSGSWQTMAWRGRPTRRAGHTAVWTGDEMIVFGGRDPDRDLSSVRTGGRYRL